MIIAKLKNENPFKPNIVSQFKILSYGEGNDLPQIIMKLSNSSPTAIECIEILHTFLYAGGFSKQSLNNQAINSDNMTMFKLLERITYDYAFFGGFAIHVNDNGLFPIPFENIRIGIPDNNYNVNYYAVHPNWTGEKVNGGQYITVDISQITYIHSFKKDKIDSIRQRKSEGYIGQLYYFKNEGITQYPLPLYYSALTDISTEAGLINLCYRNARFNFFPAGILTKVDTQSHNQTEEQKRAEELMDTFRQFQGDSEASKILYMPTDDPANVPQFIPFPTQNLDTQFEVTNTAVKDRIGRVFNQPPILRAEDVGGNFGSDAIRNAYQYYNTVVSGHRKKISDALLEINSLLKFTNSDLEISSNNYVNTDDIRKFTSDELLTISTIINSPIPSKNKVELIKMGYGLTEKEAQLLVPSDEEKLEFQEQQQEAFQQNMNNNQETASNEEP